MKRILLICMLAVASALFMGARQRFNTELIDSTTVSVPLRDGTRTVFITPNSGHAIVYAYSGGIAVDTLRVKAGTGFKVYVAGRDSLRIERPKHTMVSWVKNPSYDDISGGYMNEFSKACPFAHGDTLANAATTMSYSVRLANLDEDHVGHCNNFQSCIVSSVGNAASRLFIKIYSDEHLLAQFHVPAGEVFQTEAWTFDSMLVTTQGVITYASYSVSWNHGSF